MLAVVWCHAAGDAASCGTKPAHCLSRGSTRRLTPQLMFCYTLSTCFVTYEYSVYQGTDWYRQYSYESIEPFLILQYSVYTSPKRKAPRACPLRARTRFPDPPMQVSAGGAPRSFLCAPRSPRPAGACRTPRCELRAIAKCPLVAQIYHPRFRSRHPLLVLGRTARSYGT